MGISKQTGNCNFIRKMENLINGQWKMENEQLRIENLNKSRMENLTEWRM